MSTETQTPRYMDEYRAWVPLTYEDEKGAVRHANTGQEVKEPAVKWSPDELAQFRRDGSVPVVRVVEVVGA